MCSLVETNFDANQKIWSGVKRKPFYSTEINLGEVILHRLSMSPNNIVQIFDPNEETLKAGQLLKQSKAVALYLMQIGLQPGDVVGIAATNSANLAAVVIGAFLCGTPIHAVYPELDKDTIKVIYEVSTPKIIFCDAENYTIVKQAVDELEFEVSIFIVNGKVQGEVSVRDFIHISVEPNAMENFPCSKLTGEAIAFILCSSGSTGPPKGVTCTHTAALNMEFYIPLDENSVMFTFSDLFWATGFFTLVSALKTGCKRIITNKPFTPEYFIHLVETYRITHVFMSNAQAALIASQFGSEVRERLDSIYIILSGGAKVAHKIIDRFREILGDKLRPGFTIVYGMSEVSGTCLTMYDNGPEKIRFGNEGRLYPNVEMRIVGENGEILGIGEKGKIHVRTPYHWPGYYRNPKATNDAYQDNWFKSCDFGYFDEHGYLTVCTRDSEIFKHKGFQIVPQLIENVIAELPGVEEVCVFGEPDLVSSNLVACAVSRSPNEDGAKLSESDIKDHVKRRLMEACHISGGLYFVNAFPRTSTGKILRRKVIDIIRGNM